MWNNEPNLPSGGRQKWLKIASYLEETIYFLMGRMLTLYLWQNKVFIKIYNYSNYSLQKATKTINLLMNLKATRVNQMGRKFSVLNKKQKNYVIKNKINTFKNKSLYRTYKYAKHFTYVMSRVFYSNNNLFFQNFLSKQL